MAGIKVKRYRKVMCTDAQMLLARQNKKFKPVPGTPKLHEHRPFVEWLFRHQHKCVVSDHTKLKYNYMMRNRVCVIEIEGEIGPALQFL